MARPLPMTVVLVAVAGRFRRKLSRNAPRRARSSHPIIKPFDDEAERLDVEEVACGLGDPQNAQEPFAIGGGVVNGVVGCARVTLHCALRSCPRSTAACPRP